MSRNVYQSLLELARPKDNGFFMRLEDTLLEEKEAKESQEYSHTASKGPRGDR